MKHTISKLIVPVIALILCVLTLIFFVTGIRSAGKSDAAADTEAKRQMIVDYLTEHSSASSARIGASLGLSLRRTRELLRSLRQENVVAARGGGKYRVYSLRSDTRDKTH